MILLGDITWWTNEGVNTPFESINPRITNFKKQMKSIAQVVPELFNFKNSAVTSHRCKAYRG